MNFLSLWLLSWPGGRVDGQEGVPGVLGWAVLDGIVHPFSFSHVFNCNIKLSDGIELYSSD